MKRTAAQTARLQALLRLYSTADWPGLAREAQRAAEEDQTVAEYCGLAAQALRHLNDFEAGYQWAVRGVAVDPTSYFCLSRLSLLANLTGRFTDARDAALANLDRAPTTSDDRGNYATLFVNAIHAMARLGKVKDAVEPFTPVIERLDHELLHFNAACLYALAEDGRVHVHMRKALSVGQPKHAFTDTDFDLVRGQPAFITALARDWDRERKALANAGTSDRAALRPDHFVLELVTGRAATEQPRNPQLEQAIAASPSRPEPRLVYADWLLERSSLRGDFILATRRCDEAQNEDDRMLAYAAWASLFEDNAGTLVGPLVPWLGQQSRVSWSKGFASELVFDLGLSKRGHAFEGSASELLGEVLDHDSFPFLERLSVGDVWADDVLDYRPLIEVLVARRPSTLRALSFMPQRMDLSSTELDATGLAEAFPALERLRLGAGRLETGRLAFPELRALTLHSGGLSQRNLAAVCTERWPKLEALELLFGTPQYGADTFEPRDVAPVLTGRAAPNLKRLGLRNAEFTDALCGSLATAPVLRQLEELDLSLGTMTDAGAEVLLRHAAAFHHLEVLNVDENVLSREGLEALQRALPCVTSTGQKVDRYVSVGE